MKTSNASPTNGTAKEMLGIMALIASILTFAASPALGDIPTRKVVPLHGMYQVSASNDPFFPMGEEREWFLDFGDGMQHGELSGKVAISLRENPSVRVRIMVWQYFPRENVLLIGNQFEEGSGQAVARGVWSVGSDSGETFLLGQRSSITLKKPVSYDY